MDHATSLSQVQRANLNLLLLMRDAAMRDMGDAVCSFGLARPDFAAIMSRAPDELLSCGIGDQALFLPRSDLSSLLAPPAIAPAIASGPLGHRAGHPSRRRLSASRR
jgi:hypothetical protein